MINRFNRVFAERCRYGSSIAIHLAIESDSGISAAMPLVVEKVHEGQRSEPCMELHKETAQRLMDELWNCGLRPSEGSGSAGAMAATERHLADMKALAFHALKVGK